MLSGRPGRRAVVQCALLSAASSTTFARSATSCSSICAAPGNRRRSLCPELGQPGADGVFDDQSAEHPAPCARAARASNRRADLRQYTTEIAVDDLEEVRQALGYGPINLYGTSYGIARRAGLHARAIRARVRAVAMKGDGAAVDGDARNARARRRERPGSQLVARCCKDAGCAKTPIPRRRRTSVELLKRLEQHPPIVDAAGKPSSGRARAIMVSRGLFAEAFRNVLYTPEGSAQAPKLIHQLRRRRRSRPGRNRAGRPHGSGRRTSGGGLLSVGDVHRRRSVSPEGCGRAGGWHVRRQLPPRAATRRLQGVAARHRVVRASSADASRAIPTLLLSGEFDPVTPPAGAEEVAAQPVEGPPRRHPQQRASDRQRRAVHRRR